MGEIVNAYQNAMLLVLFSTSSFLQDVGLWGGSMAIKKRDFDEMGVGEYWSQTVVDDMSLSKLVMKYSKKSIMVTPCITPTDDTLPTISQSIKWFERQVMFLKAYQKKTWVSAILLVISCLFFQLLLPVSIIISFATSKTFAGIGGIAALTFLFGTLFTTLLYPMLGKQPALIRFLLLQPVSLFTVLIGTFRTLFTNTVSWSGFFYKLNFSGKVVSVEQQ
jgi:cellulose synthase/poly-beta-1,6-N-acetylglucosamine synthase-like glycosyltransferase